MLFYSQSKGEWTTETGEVISTGWYAGGNEGQSPQGVNNPAFQAYRDVGPLPQNIYSLSPLHTVQRLGPSMALTPEEPQAMFGRAGFLLHLGNPAKPPQSSSEGCAVAPNYTELAKIEALRIKGESQITVTA